MTPVRAESTSRVVFHADDFGMNAAVNQGILQSFRNGLLTSTSLLANAPAAESASRDWPALLDDFYSNNLLSLDARRKLGDPCLPFDLGIHLNLTQGRPLTGKRYPSELLDPEGNFPGIVAFFFRMRRANSAQINLVATELQAQIEWMRDRGHSPTHLNGHQYVELIPQIASMIPGLLRRYSIKAVRIANEPSLTRNGLLKGHPAAWGLGLVKRYYAKALRQKIRGEDVAFPSRFFGTIHAGRIDLKTILGFLGVRSNAEFTEIGLHPSVEPSAADICEGTPWFDPLAAQRPKEREWLCGTELPNLLFDRGVRLGRLQTLQVRSQKS